MGPPNPVLYQYIYSKRLQQWAPGSVAHNSFAAEASSVAPIGAANAVHTRPTTSVMRSGPLFMVSMRPLRRHLLICKDGCHGAKQPAQPFQADRRFTPGADIWTGDPDSRGGSAAAVSRLRKNPSRPQHHVVIIVKSLQLIVFCATSSAACQMWNVG